MVTLFMRAQKGLAPQNDFERDMYRFLDGLDARHREALANGFDAYLKIPDGRRCGFETRLDDWPDDRPLDPVFLGKLLTQEIIALGRYGVFAKQDGQSSVGEMRLWDQSLGPSIDGTNPGVVTGPWPWICAINPGADNVRWYRNRDVVFPDHSDLSAVKFDAYEFSITCTTTTDPANPKSVHVDCKDNVPSPGSSGFSFATCDGGNNYGVTDSATGRFRCLKIPLCVAGQGVAFRGFNYLSLHCTVLVRKVGGGFPDMMLPGDVMGDDNPPSKAATCGVRDVLTFTIPRSIRDGLNDRPVPPGRYTIEVHVPNDLNFAPTAGPVPSEFVSNTALIEIVPPLDLTYQVWCERGNCYSETSGLGSDEPWFRSYTASYRALGTQVIDLHDADIFNQEDIDSGDWINFNPVSPFSGRLETSGVVAIAVMGLEVDSEDAARDQVTSFGEAYGLYYKQLFTGLAGSGAGGVFGVGLSALIDTGVITASLVAGGIALIVIAALGLLWASWAPADPIAYDLLIFDQVNLFLLSNPGSLEPPSNVGSIGGIDWVSMPRGFTITSATSAEYREEHQYMSADEESRYGLDFMITRLPS
jgi:hypothetical protein